MSYESLLKEAGKLAQELERRGKRLVLAESCTGGQAAGALAAVPGVSKFFCGSFVTYRDDSKARWLAIDRSELARRGAVQARIARAMAEGALKRTPEADIAGSVTGHLGPQAPGKLDGLVFLAVAWRSPSGVRVRVTQSRFLPVLKTNAKSKQTTQGAKLRGKRQLRASLALLHMVRTLLKLA